MSWLKNIYESIVQEIGADDAYNRFYSSIPREDYDYILDGDPAPDKFVQFVLNCVRDGKNDKSDARAVIDNYKTAEQLVKQKVLQKFRNGEYEDCEDIASDIEYFSSGGAILSRKKFAKEGYIKIKENDYWLVTCTTNYTASNHYFGDTRWCTASDRDGNYDGYEMFKNYTTTDTWNEMPEMSSVLVQFSWKGPVRNDDDDPEPLDESESPWPSGEEYDGWNKKEIDRRYSKIQAQIEIKDKRYGQICDYYDNSMSYIKLKNIVGTEIYECVRDENILSWLKDREGEQYAKEEKYQKAYESARKAKRERRLRAAREERNRLNDEALAFNRQKEALVLQKWGEFIDNKMYLDKSVLSEIVKRDIFAGYVSATEENYASTNYASITNFEVSRPDGKTNVMAGYISPILGMVKEVDYGYDRNDIPTYKLIDDMNLSPMNGVYSVAIVFTCDGDNNVVDSRVIEERCNGDSAVRFLDSNVIARNGFMIGGHGGSRFVMFSIVPEYHTQHLFDTITMTEIEGVDVPVSTYYEISDDLFVLYRDGDGGDFDFYRPSVGKAFNSQDYGRVIYELNYGNGISLVGNGTNRLYFRAMGLNGFTVKEKRAITGIDYYEGKIVAGDVIGVVFEYGGANAFQYEGNGELIFGINGKSVHAVGNRRVAILLDKKKYKEKDILIFDADKGYFVVEGGEQMPCDRFGKTEKEKMAEKNFADWKANGGHSPEVKAQMDKMWADRNGDNIMSGEGAFRDWNDDDRKLDATAANSSDLKGLDSNNFFNGLTGGKFNDTQRYGALKDPEGYSKQMGRYLATGDFDLSKDAPDYIRRDPWYRIGKDGKPLDQPWYDEDEIPARLSDRVVREQEINEGINKMRSIWGRMGLND